MNTNNHHFEFKIWDYTIKLFYSLFGKLLALLFPLLSLIAIGILVLLTSTVIYSSIRYSLLPRAIIHEPVYFNFATSEPVAKIDILESNRQWISNRDVQLESAQKSHFKSSSSFSSVDDVDDSAVSTSAPSSSSFSSSRQDLNTEYKRYFKPSATYTFHSTIEVANSRRNIELGKFMLSIRLFDSTGRVIASSARPVVVPYQSPLSVTLQTLFWSPLVIIGLFRRHEKHSILVTFMDDFAEPGHMQPPTAVVELSLSTNQADVTSTYLTVMPALYGITYYLYYFPTISFVVGVSVISAFISSSIILMLLVLWLADMISGSSTTRTSQAERRPLTTSHGSEASNSVPPSVISSVPGSAFAAPTAFAPNNATIGRVVGGEPMSARSSDAGQSDITNSVQSVHYVAQSSSIQRLWRAYSISTNKTPYSERLGEVQEDRVLNRANTAAVNHASETDVIHVGMLNDTPENKLFTPIVDDNADEDSPVQRSGMRQRRRSNSMLELK